MPAGQRNFLVVLLQERVIMDDVKDWLRCVTKALMHMHQQGLIHGDIKPLNVMRMSDGKNVWKLVSGAGSGSGLG